MAATIPTLPEKALLVKLSIACWEAKERNQKASAEIRERYGAADDAGEFITRIIPSEFLAELKALKGLAYNTNYAMTLPWDDKGYRIIPSSLYFRYCEVLGDIKRRFEEARALLGLNYEAVKEASRKTRKGLVEDTKFPSLAELEAKFDISITFRPLSTGGDFRVALADEELARLRADLDAETEARLKSSREDLIGKVLAPVEALAEKLAKYVRSADGKLNARIHDTLVSNVQSIADLATALNLTGDSRLSQIVSEIATDLCQHSVEVLKDDDKIRTQVAARAAELAKELRGIDAPPAPAIPAPALPTPVEDDLAAEVDDVAERMAAFF